LETQSVRLLEVGLSILFELQPFAGLKDAADLAAELALLNLVGCVLDLVAELGDILSFPELRNLRFRYLNGGALVPCKGHIAEFVEERLIPAHRFRSKRYRGEIGSNDSCLVVIFENRS
jgi:hypothetical protein